MLVTSRMLTVTLPKVAADSGTYRIVQLNNLPAFTDITNLFQEYRIDLVEYIYQMFTPNANNTYFTSLYVAPQRTTLGGTPSSLDEVQQFAGLKVFQFGPTSQEFRISVKPSLSMDVNNSGGYGSIRTSPWISCQNSSAVHMTVVDWLNNYNTSAVATPNNVNLLTRIHITARRAR